MPFKPLPQDQPSCTVECPACGHRWLVYEQQLGLLGSCPACGAARPRYMGGVAPGSGRQVSFGSFRDLMLDEPRLLSLIEQALGLSPLDGERFVDAQGREVPLEDIHYALQGNAEWQGTLYNLHMSRAR
ncbi:MULTISPECIES: hypothetical protein [unclassified Deinococcus]|uniref:hypothetical protein n=1 Tax=unclassified Deinococcus TaxID=2623546 RepID=UPI0006DC0B85|nr:MULTISPECIES: hypothetical protein [unclassified Deinococcus]MCD0175183.1 hypothetical protein [Deinococcus sp. 14RED07]PIG95844.1 hypothetical protein AMD26_019385 [Deinococcus sp. UR1]